MREFNGRLWISDPLSKLRVIVSQLLRAVTPLSVAHPSRHSLGHDESENLRSSREWPTACQESGCSVKPRPSLSADSHIIRTSYEATDLKNKTWIVILGWLGYYYLLPCLLKLNYWKISEFLAIQNVQCMIIVNKCFLSSFRYSKVIYQCMIIFFLNT